MKAKVGDWLVINGATMDLPGQRGLITELRSPDGAPPYVVHWLDSDHVALVFPGPDAAVLTAQEQEMADEQALQRVSSVQSAIMRLSRTDS